MGEFRAQVALAIAPADASAMPGNDPRFRRAGPIGAHKMVHRITLSTLRRGDGEWLFGPELPSELRTVDRSFQRRDPQAGTLRTVDFRRQEFVLDSGEAKALGIVRGQTLVVANLPLGQRRFQTAPLQGYADRAPPFLFEDLTGPPLPTTEAGRAALSDVDAMHCLNRLAVNRFPSKGELSANLVGTQAGAFVGYDDAEWIIPVEREGQAAAQQARGEISANVRRDGCYAMGIVPDLEAVRAELYTHKLLRRISDDIGDVRYRIPIPGKAETIPVPLEISELAPMHFQLAIFQALAGAGVKTGIWFGRPLARYVLDIFHYHLREAIRRMDQRLVPHDILPLWENTELPIDCGEDP